MRIRPFPLLPRSAHRDARVEQTQAALLLPVMRQMVAKGRNIHKENWIALAAALRGIRSASVDTEQDLNTAGITKPEESDGVNTTLSIALNAYSLELMAQTSDALVVCTISTPEHTVALFGSSVAQLYYLLDITKSRLFVAGSTPKAFEHVFEQFYGKMVASYQCYMLE